MPKGAKLTLKQRKFCLAYLKSGNATQAAIEAGYSEKTAQEQSSRLLSNVILKQFIESHQAKLEESTGITAEKVLNRLWEIQNQDGIDRVSALKAIQKQQGYEKPTEVKHSGEIKTTMQIVVSGNAKGLLKQ